MKIEKKLLQNISFWSVVNGTKRDCGKISDRKQSCEPFPCTGDPPIVQLQIVQSWM